MINTKKMSVPSLLFLLAAGTIIAAHFQLIDLYVQTVIMFIGVNIILSSSFNIINGYMGEFACGHAGFMAVGAYVTSVLNIMFFTNSKTFGQAIFAPELALYFFPVTMFIGGVAAAITGLLVAVPSFKTRDDYLAIITLAANFIIVSLFINMDVIGGARGFMGMKQIVFAMEDVAYIPWMLIWVFTFTYFTVFVIRRFVTSTYGKGIIAIHQDEIAAEIMSVNTNKMKLVAFMLSSGLAGLAGGLFAHILGYINPNSFGILKSTECLVMVYLGGMGSLSGSIIAAVIFTLLIEGLRFIIPAADTLLHLMPIIPDTFHLSQVLKWVIIPLILVILMQFRPEGLMGNRELSDFFPKLKKYYEFK
ncbi:Inner-membrane translocator [Desulfamplus magnetovallimortis]|uniref:Inner-membrane translocator n=1 Tax=Desulfamplus magnetovallimortis TaxID=1246637 RepID=A0A1W1HHC6_9BACT|nr:branched-chain amino acid ABC transporter permease [Desulfamplus magnetovallimortis]SLM31833.1 Inner-membrane translocator [Desulfamplus magnetovallimortis]